MMLFTDGSIDMTISQNKDSEVTEPHRDNHLTTAVQIESSKDQILDNGKDLFISYVTQSHQPYDCFELKIDTYLHKYVMNHFPFL